MRSTAWRYRSRVARVIARVRARRVAAKDRFGRARALDERVQSMLGDGAKAGDGVRHHELRERQLLDGSLRRILDGHDVFRHPLLEPEQRREVGPPAANLLQEARQKRRRERSDRDARTPRGFRRESRRRRRARGAA